jgi:DNA-binding beta-propeller fold protein YncE
MRTHLFGILLAGVTLTGLSATDEPALPGSLLPVDQTLTPYGKQVYLPSVRPKVLALSPDGRLLVTSGSTDRLIVLDPVTGEIRQTTALPLEKRLIPATGSNPLFMLMPELPAEVSFTGIAFSPDGTRLFLSGVNGTIKVFTVEKNGSVHGLGSFALPPANAPRRRAEVPSGIAVSADGRRLYVAANLSNGLLELDAETGSVLRRFEVGVEPYDVVLGGDTAYVSNWGGRRPDRQSATGPAGKGTFVRVDSTRFIASEGSVSMVDLASGHVLELVTGRHASGLAATGDGRFVAVANAGDDTVSVIQTSTHSVVETFSLRWHSGDLFGASPNALAFDKKGRVLFVCNGTQNAIAAVSFGPEARWFEHIFSPKPSRLLGLIPVGWYPGAVAWDEARKALYVANLKGEGRQTISPSRSGYRTHGFIGSVSLVPRPDRDRLMQLTGEVLANYRRAVVETARLPARPGEPPRPVPERVGEPSVFRHVIYIIKENRCYDQILGDMKEGNGDPSLCVFGEKVTPNQHKLAREFVLLDNAYCAGILSADGHMWATTAFATDYVEKSFSAFPRSYTYGGYIDGFDAMAYSPAGFIWDDAVAHGVTLRNYGEFMLSKIRWTDPKRKDKLSDPEIYRDCLNETGEVAVSCTPGIPSLAAFSKRDTIGWPPTVPDTYRVDRFLEEFRGFVRSGNLPAFIILYLPEDHTFGTNPGMPTPAAMVAGNDLAVGRVVEALSHSRYWKDTCLFATEDDPQDGWDHVSGYRTTSYVASAYTKRRATVSERYTQPGMLRTIELMLGLPPMNQMDASAAPWAACFQETPDLTPFDAVPAGVSPLQMNPPPTAIKDATLRREALISAHLPFDQADQCPEDVLNRILWHAQMGSKAPYPQWAVLAHPTDPD